MRLRILLLLAGVAAAIALWRWSPGEPPITPLAATPTRAPMVRQAGDTEPGGWQPMNDSEFVATMKDFVILTVYHDSAWFAFTSPDSAVDLHELGFIPAMALLDTARRFDVVGHNGSVWKVAATSSRAVDSAVRHMDTSCLLGVPIHLRALAPPTDTGGTGFLPAAASMVPPSVWQLPGSSADRLAAIELSRRFPPRGSGEAPDTSWYPSAHPDLQVVAAFRFTIEDVEFLIGKVRGVITRPAYRPGEHYTENEQRIFIAERPASDTGASFRLGWWAQGMEDGERRAEFEPTALLRLGPKRLLTFVLDAGYGDGGGDTYLTRLGPLNWHKVASSYFGC